MMLVVLPLLLFVLAEHSSRAFSLSSLSSRKHSAWGLSVTSLTPTSNEAIQATAANVNNFGLGRRSLELHAKLWDRLQIEEDPEPFWYLINCVAGLEMDLLRQCREVCKDMPDAIKFVVPTEKKTRSHGAKKMVTETKVKYQGYVFAKLRLCPEVYEAIQGLDLCRSWMGTVNHKGHRKLPPAPIALNEVEVENFGLEQVDEEDEEDEDSADIIVDVAEEDDAGSKLDKEAIKVYLGLKVEDMVKVTARGKFFNEDGIIRRLKDGKLLVRFYTYGTMFEEWLNPTDVRKLSNIEILKGLSGPSRPVTQRDFDGPSDDYEDRGRPGGGGGDWRRERTPGPGQRNRRQDRTERRFRQDQVRDDDERGRNDRNWNWYQDQQQDSRRRNDFRDRSYGYQAGSNNNNNNNNSPRRDRGGDWAIGNVDSQWGRNNNPNRRERQPRRNNDVRRDNRMADAALRGEDDWSAFVTQPGSNNKGKNKKSGGLDDVGDDDFFASLMNDLSDDLGSKTSSSSSSRSRASKNDDDIGDDFFSSLLSEITDGDNDEDSGATNKRQSKPRKEKTHASNKGQDEDFFAALEAEFSSAFDDDISSSGSKLDDSDDLFAKLEAELSPTTSKNNKPKTTKAKPAAADKNTDDFFAELAAELPPSSMDDNSADDFFAALEADLAPEKVETSVDEKPMEKPKHAKKESSTAAKKSTSSSSKANSMNPEHLAKQTVPALKEMLRERGLKVSGKKTDLIDRLLQES